MVWSVELSSVEMLEQDVGEDAKGSERVPHAKFTIVFSEVLVLVNCIIRGQILAMTIRSILTPMRFSIRNIPRHGS